MIRRNITLADGTSCWSLISQVEHARLSGELAAAWGNEQFTSVICQPRRCPPVELLAVRNEVLAAITHHDDGWCEWEALPKMDPKHQRPYSFMEMPLTESLAIWRKSIMRCKDIGPLAAWMVAGHFIELRNNSETQTLKAGRWVDEMSGLRSQWLAGWQSTNPEVHTQHLAEQALLWLRWFDALSLWLCFRKSDPFSFPHEPSGSLELNDSISFIPQESGAHDELQIVCVEPWPFQAADIDLQATSSLIRTTECNVDRRCVGMGERVLLRWQLTSRRTARNGKQ